MSTALRPMASHNVGLWAGNAGISPSIWRRTAHRAIDTSRSKSSSAASAASFAACERAFEHERKGRGSLDAKCL